ncbi:MAG: hypothetical protein Q8907_16055 [Bacteroidota bacterium]|nr:hypothetical protein [Bacteroidota bacterium]
MKWETIDLNYTGDLNDIFILPNDTIMLLSRFDHTYKKTCGFESDDAGKTWKQNCFDTLSSSGFSNFYCFSHLKIFAGNYRSYNGGNNWQTLGNFKGGLMYFFNNSTGIGVSGFSIFKTIDGGNSFQIKYDTVSYVGC